MKTRFILGVFFVFVFLALVSMANAQSYVRRKSYLVRSPIYHQYYPPSGYTSPLRSPIYQKSVVVIREIKIYESRINLIDYARGTYRPHGYYPSRQISTCEYYYPERENRYSNQKNLYYIEKSLKEIGRKISVLEEKISKNVQDIKEVGEIKEELVELKRLLLEFKRRNLR